MKVHTFWIVRKGEYAPEILVAVDEFVLEDNPTWFDNEVKKQLSLFKEGELSGSSKVILWVDEDAIQKACIQGLELSTKIVE